MTQKGIPSIYEPIDLDVKELFTSGEPLTFLVGAGISIEPPSALQSAWQIMEAILQFGAVEKEVEKLLKMPNLRFEYLIGLFKNQFDEDLIFLNYFEEATEPNIIHKFLARMVQEGHFVMTTNFDSLIERAIGLDNDKLKLVITQEDFKRYGDPQKNWKKGLLVVYKLHGSLKNHKTGEKTKESIVITLEALGRYKEGEILSVQAFQRETFEKIGQGRTLLIMGYSGGDDFDVVPTLMQMKGLKRIIWIAHEPKADIGVTSYRIIPQVGVSVNADGTLSHEDKLLHNMSQLEGLEVIKMVGHTASLIIGVTGEFYDYGKSPEQQNMYQWLVEHLDQPIEGIKELFTALIFETYRQYSEALGYYQQAYELSKRVDNFRTMAAALSNMGLIYKRTEPEKALESHQKSYEVLERLEDLYGMAGQLINIGLIHMDWGELQKALEHFQKSYEICEPLGHSSIMAIALGNIGIIYWKKGQAKKALEYFQKSYKINEQIGGLKGMATQLGNIGGIYREMDELQKALEHFKKSYEINERLEDLYGMAAQLSNMALIYEANKEFRIALENFQRAYKIFEQLKYRREMRRITNTIERVKQQIQNKKTKNT
ncbi:MAG: tetratricopeptide repeat protein [Promethearchaeota archaeon]